MTTEIKNNPTPTNKFRWYQPMVGEKLLQQLFVVERYYSWGEYVDTTEVWVDVPVIQEHKIGPPEPSGT